MFPAMVSYRVTNMMCQSGPSAIRYRFSWDGKHSIRNQSDYPSVCLLWLFDCPGRIDRCWMRAEYRRASNVHRDFADWWISFAIERFRRVVFVGGFSLVAVWSNQSQWNREFIHQAITFVQRWDLLFCSWSVAVAGIGFWVFQSLGRWPNDIARSFERIDERYWK